MDPLRLRSLLRLEIAEKRQKAALVTVLRLPRPLSEPRALMKNGAPICEREAYAGQDTGHREPIQITASPLCANAGGNAASRVSAQAYRCVARFAHYAPALL
jgi:hypothetical protein